MHILHIDTGTSWRGGQNQVRLLLKGLSSHGIHSTLVIPDTAGHKDRFSNCDQISLRMNGISQFWAAQSLNRLCSEKKIQLIHAHSSKAHNIAMIMKLSGSRLPLVVHRRVMFPYSKNFISGYKYSSNVVSQFVAVSEAIRNYMIREGTSESQISVIHSSKEQETPATSEQKQTASAAIKKSLNLPDTALIAGFCGALTQEKGCKTLIQCIPSLPSFLSHLHFVIAGSGDQEPELKSMIRNPGLSKRVHFLGFLDDTTQFLRSLDLLVFPSLSEGLGTTLLEAAYQRCPVIASDTGGIPEIIKHQKTGLLVAPGDDTHLKEAMITLCEEPQLREDYAGNLLDHVRTGFSPETMTSGHHQLYQKLLGIN